MAIPDYQTCMLPLLTFAGDGNSHSLREAVDYLSEYFNLTTTERKALLPSGQQGIFVNRVSWARTYMKQAGLVESPKRGYFRITDRGREVLNEKPISLNVKYLERFADFRAFLRRKRGKTESIKEIQIEKDLTPAEALESAFENLQSDLQQELLEQLRTVSPSLFEKIVVELIVKMGYGGSRKDAGQAVGGSRDGGIDGIIKEDRLGLDIIYIQAKRWETVVSRPEIQKFAGALQGQRAKKGIFITTSNFSREALEYVGRIDSKIILIDGNQLAQFMIENNVGVTTISLYEVKKIDFDYFTDE